MVSVQELLDNGVLIDPGLVEQGIPGTVLGRILEKYGEDLVVIEKDMVEECADPQETGGANVEVIWSYDQEPKKRTYDDFVKLLQTRFRELEHLLKTRQELASTTSINRIKAKQDRDHVSVIAMVKDKSETANNNIMLVLEDFSGTIKALISCKKQELFDLAKDVQLDEVLGFTGMGAGDIIFVDNIIFPDIPLTKELKKAPREEYAAFIGDPHFGSKAFLKDDFERMLLWLQGKAGNDEQRALAAKVRYVFITGDLVEGVGVYPGQENDLTIKDIKEQYAEAAEYLSRIPPRMRIILFTGNHDAGRLSEPQEPIMREYAPQLYHHPNITITSNPSMVNIGAADGFPGLDCLLYHGGSFIYYADTIPSIRAAGGQKRVDLIMRYLLQRRHLAPTHNAAMTIPTTDKDWLLIDRVPDLFISGHIHRVSVSNYRNVTCINAGCWTEITEDQVKRGLEPQPSKLIIIGLHNRQVKLMNFKKERSAPAKRTSDEEQEDP
ncbi:metallophosphoesterase [Candidatus Woesearchaeota archaeon]|nr:metallophosphoesterase [Candidatus Woesearchaeota archaeon]